MNLIDPSYLAYLDSIDLTATQERIRAFRATCDELDDKALRKALWDIFLVKGSGVLPAQVLNFGFEGTYWRARVTGERDPRQIINTRRDLWAPPPDKVGLGRLNTANSPLLYTALNDPYTAALEVRPEIGANVCLVRYQPMKPIRLINFKDSVDPQRMSSTQRQKHRTLSGFIEQEVFNPSDDHRRYRITALITTDMFDYPPKITEGWIYASLRHPGGTNIAIRERQARRVLKPTQLHACIWNSSLKCHAVSDLWNLTANGFSWREPTPTEFTY